MERIIDRLAIYMKTKGLNDNQVTVQCGLAVGLIGNARNGKADLGRKSIDKVLSTYKDLNPAWLITGDGEMLTNNNTPTNPADTVADSDIIEILHEQLKEKDEQIRGLIAALNK